MRLGLSRRPPGNQNSYKTGPEKQRKQVYKKTVLQGKNQVKKRTHVPCVLLNLIGIAARKSSRDRDVLVPNDPPRQRGHFHVVQCGAPA